MTHVKTGIEMNLTLFTKPAALKPKGGKTAQMMILSLSIIALASTALNVCSSFGGNQEILPAEERGIVDKSLPNGLYTLDQNWTTDEAMWFYEAPQGSKYMPYKWFINLEQKGSTELFKSAEHMASLGFIPRLQVKGRNQDGLPLGFVKDGDSLGLSCAACHSEKINYQGTGFVIDGGPTGGDIEMFQREVVAALMSTQGDPAKWNRFAAAVLGSAASHQAQEKLSSEVSVVIKDRASYNERNLPASDAARYGPRRVDAFGAILNEVAGTFCKVGNNLHSANAPVSYPFLWDTPQHDRVQWNGSAKNKKSWVEIGGTKDIGALGRNVGEVLGVFGFVDATNAGALGRGGYPSSIHKDNLIELEKSVRKLWSPRWPSAFGSLDQIKVAQGKGLFVTNCVHCHSDNFDRTANDRVIVAELRRSRTDQLMASNFAQNVSKTGVLSGRFRSLLGFDKFEESARTRELLVHMVERAVLGSISQKITLADQSQLSPEYEINADLLVGENLVVQGPFTELTFDTAGYVSSLSVTGKDSALSLQDRLMIEPFGPGQTKMASEAVIGDLLKELGSEAINVGGRSELRVKLPDGVRADYKYKARPLNGIWATAPYLHNGSVPNLEELLKPAKDRVSVFHVGSSEFDPKSVGFRSDVGDFTFDTALLGNSNCGHEYGVFSNEERAQLIEYLKSL